MIKQLFLGIAAILLAAGKAAQSFADGAPDEAAPSSDTPEKPAGRPRGRPAKTNEEGPADGPTDEERLEKNKLLIKPLVEGGQGEDVKKVIAKYSSTGLKGIPADKQAAFEKDVDGLSY